jgi:hypothetical protein
MTETSPITQWDLATRLARSYYLRTGHRYKTEVFLAEIQRKFNPYHDPNNGQFTFGPGTTNLTGRSSSAPIPAATQAPYPVRVELRRSYPARTEIPRTYPVRIELPRAVPVIRFRHSAELDLPDEVVDRANSLSESVRVATGHEIHVTSGRRSPARQAVAMYNNFVRGTPAHYLNRVAQAEVHQAFQNGQQNGMSRDQIVGAMANVLTAQTTRGIFLSRHMTSRAVDIRTPPAAVLQAIRNHPSVQSVGVENSHIHIQFH